MYFGALSSKPKSTNILKYETNANENTNNPYPSIPTRLIRIGTTIIGAK